MKPIEGTYNLLKEPKNIVITMHQKPDGDALGSSWGLAHWLIGFGHNVSVVSPTNWPDFLAWLPGCGATIDFENSPQKALPITENADIIFFLDHNHPSRLKGYQDITSKVTCTKILIDHHQQPLEDFYSFGISDTSKSSTCQMVYDYIKASPNPSFSFDTAVCLYTGLMTDTGNFKFPSTTSDVHLMAAELIGKGVKPTEINSAVFDQNSENRLRFLGNILLQKMEIDYKLNTGIISIPQSDLIKYNIKTGDTEGLVNFPLSVKGIKLSFIVIDRGDERKISFRSKGDIDVNSFARKYFNGGGHKNAAGGASSDTLENVVLAFKEKVKELTDQLTDY